MDISEDQIADLRSQAANGDAAAKEMLTALTPPAAPAKAEETNSQNAPAPEAKADGEVDQEHDRNGSPEKRPSKMDTIRDLRRKRREEQAAFENYKAEAERRLQSFETQLKALQTPQKTGKAAEDILGELLSKPDEFLSAREQRLIEQMKKIAREEMRQVPQIISRRQEMSNAVKLLESVPNFDMDRDEDEVFDLMQSEYGLDERDVEELLATKPVKTAGLIKRAWERNHMITPEAKKDKAAATSGTVVGTPARGGKMTLGDINSRARGLVPGSPEWEALLLEAKTLA